MNPFPGPDRPAEPNRLLVRYLAGQVSLEVAAAEYTQLWIEWLQAGEVGSSPALGNATDVDNLSEADAKKTHALLQRVTSILEDYETKKGAREYLSSAGNSEFDQAVRRLADDVKATLGEQQVAVVWRFAAHARTLDIEDASSMRDRCVEDVQQYFQDTFVDTTWPACPRHPNHPLDFADGSWQCPRDHTVIARLGELDAPLAK